MLKRRERGEGHGGFEFEGDLGMAGKVKVVGGGGRGGEGGPEDGRTAWRQDRRSDDLGSESRAKRRRSREEVKGP
jgi:hypothetical protein